MKIAFFNYLPLEYGGGFANYLLTVAPGLTKKFPDISVSIVTLNPKMAQKILRLYSFYFGTFRNDLPKMEEKTASIRKKLPRVSYKTAASFKQLRSILSGHDVIYSKNDLVESAMLLLVGYSNLPRVVLGVHTPIFYEITTTTQAKLHNFLYNSSLYTLLTYQADGFHVLNAFDKKLLSGRFSKKRVEKIPNPATLLAIRSHKQNARNSQAVLFWAGRLTKEKGTDDLIALINRLSLQPEGNTINWHIAGDGPMKDAIDALANKHTNVHVHGHVPHREMEKLYHTADAFISTSKFECYPYTFIEAQSAGVPVISYDIHGCSDLVKHGKSGYLAKNIDAMEKYIRSVVRKNPFDQLAIRKHIEQQVNNEKIYSDFYAFLTNK